jgi:hypothetical protein
MIHATAVVIDFSKSLASRRVELGSGFTSKRRSGTFQVLTPCSGRLR